MKLFFPVICLVGVAQVFGLQTCQQDVNCKLPDCLCSSFSHRAKSKDYPQIVYFGFDDALTQAMANHYRFLFSPDRKNPNNCPISMSLYIQHNYTDYNIVHEMYKKGMEIGVHSVTHQNIDTRAKLLDEGKQQRENLHKLGNVPMEEIIGWRSPNLKTAGDVQPDVLKQLGYLYDISLTFTRRSFGDKRPLPYTLDYGNPLPCMVKPCPGRSSVHKGFWEIPINSLVDYKSQYPCPYVDGCYNGPKSTTDSFDYLYKNFMDYYKGGRQPFGFHMHAAWFEVNHNRVAMNKFIKHIVSLPDVYIVTAKQMLDWVRNPVSLSEIHRLPSWGCPSSTQNQILPPLKVEFPTNELIKPPNSLAAKGRPTTQRPLQQMTQQPLPTSTTRAPFYRVITTRQPPRSTSEYFVFWQRQTKKPDRSTFNPPKTGSQRASTLPPRPIYYTTTSSPRRVYTTATPAQRAWPTTHRPRRIISTPPIPRPTLPRIYQTTTPQPQKIYQTTMAPPRVHYRTASPSWFNIRRNTPRRSRIISTTTASTTTRVQRMTASPVTNKPRIPSNTDSPFSPIFQRGSGSRPGTNRQWYNFQQSSSNPLRCIQGKNCILPGCFCRTTSNPQGLQYSDTPQLVYFAFDGPVDGRVYAAYSKMFNKSKRNPDGCPISATLFVAKEGNSMTYLQNLASQGFDIALRGGNSGAYRDWQSMRSDLDDEVRMLKQQIQNVSLYGWRSPGARPLADSQFQLISSRNLKYDSTLIVRTDNKNGAIPFPYTLDFGWKDTCYTTTGCPRDKYPGLWEVPLNTVQDYIGAYQCTYADGCMHNPTTEEDTFQFLLKNFKRHYYNNKAPFGVNLRHLWFSHYLYVPNKAGLERFIRYLVGLQDVYIVNINQLVDWMRNPTGLGQLRTYQPWICPTAYYW